MATAEVSGAGSEHDQGHAATYLAQGAEMLRSLLRMRSTEDKQTYASSWLNARVLSPGMGVCKTPMPCSPSAREAEVSG